jgi:hypothetical protein
MSSRAAVTTRAAGCRADTHPRRRRNVECFTQRVRRALAVRDAEQLLIKPIHPTDAALLADGFDRLSLESRWLRYLASKRELLDFGQGSCLMTVTLNGAANSSSTGA